MTIQYISIPSKYEKIVRLLDDRRIKILHTMLHSNKLRIGHLRGNRFKLRFKKVLEVQRSKLDSVIEWIRKEGLPNYFGHQRFGRDGDNWKEGQDIISGRKRVRDRKTREFLISAYQSHLFNNWLARRIEICRTLDSFNEREAEMLLKLPEGALKGTKKQPSFFKILSGDIMMHYPYGRIFAVESDAIERESMRFVARDISPTGLISGRKARHSAGTAGIIEEPYSDSKIGEAGSRRYAWIFPEDIKTAYLPEKAHYELSFVLPRGSYATVVVDLLKGSDIGKRQK
jgi:tRNA pseudouridine13 synthase